MARSFTHRHDIVDLHPFTLANKISRACQPAPCIGLHFFSVANNMAYLGHSGKGVGFGLCCATCDDQRGIGVGVAQFANFLLGFAHGFGSDGTGVHDYRIAKACTCSQFPHGLRFIGVQSAAKRGKDRCTGWRCAVHKRACKNAALSTPSKTCMVGPVIQTPSSRQSICKRPPST